MPRIGKSQFIRIRMRGGLGGYLLISIHTTTTRNLLTPETGMVIYNSTTGQIESYNSSAWVAVGKVYTDATALPLAGGTMAGAIAMGTSKITGLGDPGAAQDAATKNYADITFATLSGGSIIGGGVNANIGTGTTTYFSPSGGVTGSSVSDGCVVVMPRAATAKNLQIRIRANASNGATTFTLYKNGAATALTLTVGAGLTGTFADDTHTVALVKGDIITIEGANAGTGNCELSGISLVLTGA